MAGSISISKDEAIDMGKGIDPKNVQKLTIAWQGDATTGVVPSLTANLSGYLIKAVTKPTIAKEVTQIVVGPDVAGSLNSTYFLISSALDAVKYYVWFDINSAGVDPAVAGRTGVHITGATNATAATLATAIKTALDALAGTPFVTVRSTATLTITNSAYGVTTDAADGAAPTGFAITVLTQGTAPTTLYDIAIGDPDDSSLDSIASQLANRSATASEQVYTLITSSNVPPFLGGSHTVSVSNNTAGGAQGTIILYLAERY